MDVFAVGLGMQLLFSLPTLLIWGVAIALAVARLHSHPRASKLLLAGASILLVASLIGVGLALLPTYFFARGHSPGELSLLLGVVGTGNALLSPVGFGLVVAAVFVDRQPNKQG